MNEEMVKAFIVFFGTVVGLGNVMVPLISGAVEIVKQANFLKGWQISLASIIIGVLLSVLIALSISEFANVPLMVLAGIVGGLTASGNYNTNVANRELKKIYDAREERVDL